MSNEVKTDFEIKTVVNPLTNDTEYIREVAEAKRALELWTMEPGFREAFLAAPEKTLSAYGLHIDSLSVKILCVHDVAMEYQTRPPEEIPRVARRYRGFIREKIRERECMSREYCVPKHPAFRAWRGRQVNKRIPDPCANDLRTGSWLFGRLSLLWRHGRTITKGLSV